MKSATIKKYPLKPILSMTLNSNSTCFSYCSCFSAGIFLSLNLLCNPSKAIFLNVAFSSISSPGFAIDGSNGFLFGTPYPHLLAINSVFSIALGMSANKIVISSGDLK